MTTTKPTLPDVLRALADGKQVHHCLDGKWYNMASFADYGMLCPANFDDASWTIVELPPPPEMVPLGPEDVPPGSAIRHSCCTNTGSWTAVVSCDLSGVFYYQQSEDRFAGVSWSSLKQWLILRPGEKEWAKCEKPKDCHANDQC